MIAKANYSEYGEILSSADGRYLALAQIDWDKNSFTVFAIDATSGKVLLRKRDSPPANTKLSDMTVDWAGRRRIELDIGLRDRPGVKRRYSF